MPPTQIPIRDSLALDGWTEQLSIRDKGRNENFPKDPIVYAKGDKRLWAHPGGATCADRVGQTLSNHRYYKSLEEAAAAES